MIRHVPGAHPGRSAAVVHDGRVFAVATCPDKPPSLLEQTRGALRALDARLAAAGTHRGLVLSATVYVTDMARKAEMNQAWLEWVDPEAPPQRACVGVALEGEDLVEIVVVAAMPEGPAGG